MSVCGFCFLTRSTLLESKLWEYKSRIIPTGTYSRPIDKKCSLAPCKSKFFPSSGVVGLCVAGLASLPFCIVALFDYLHAAVFYTLLSGAHLFMFTVLHICCNVVCLVPSIQGLLLFLAGWDRVQKTLRLFFRESFCLLLFYP